MPTYEYKCTECGHQFEKLQSMKDEPLSECPECKGKLKRLIGAGAGLIFKGTGFYITDYKNNSPHKAVKKDEANDTLPPTTEQKISSGKNKSTNKNEEKGK